MSLYHPVFLTLLAGAFWETCRQKAPKWQLYGIFGLLTALLCLRYGQGSDYFSYGHIYYELPENLFAALAAKEIHGEWGWKCLCLLGRWANMPYPAFVLVLSVGMMGLYWRFLTRFCRRPPVSLLLGWHTLYLTYFFGILRQGLVIAIFLGLLLEWLQKRRYGAYVLGCLVCASFHSSALVLLILLLLHSPWKEKHLLILCGLAWFGGAALASGIFHGILERLLPESVANYLSVEPVSLGAIAERVVTFGVILLAWYSGDRKDPQNRLLFGVVAAGFGVYGALLWMPLVASRTGFLLKAAEISLLGNLLPRKGWQKWAFFGFCIALSGGMYLKNLGSYLDHARYFEWVTVWNYPYVPLFRPEAIREYLTLPYDYLP